MPPSIQVNIDPNFLLLIYLFLFCYVLERSTFAFTVPFKAPLIRRAWLTQFPFFSYIFLFLLSVFEFSLIGLHNKWLSIAGLLVFLYGIFLRYQAIAAFKLNNEKWLSHVEPNLISKLVFVGPYQYTRHPYYLSVILELCGIALSLNALCTFLLILIVQISFLFERIKVEEEELTKKFGEDYLAYKKRVPIFLPFVRIR